MIGDYVRVLAGSSLVANVCTGWANRCGTVVDTARYGEVRWVLVRMDRFPYEKIMLRDFQVGAL